VVVRPEAGPELAAFVTWLDGQAARRVHDREVLAAIEREWVSRLVVLELGERLDAGRRIRKAIKHKKLQDAAKALSRRVEVGEGRA
jgi:hypothetical protein